ncbi:hypothetical protein AMECASPLE_033634 [Ameca splendens]|uniref:Uncharacterized protein n=1 Tax=Ameca splendens TaxID=208324 RepID=A0ABV0YTX4_9TELE
MRQHQLEGRKRCDGSPTLTTGRALTLLCWKHSSHDGEGKKLMEFCVFCHNVETTYNSRKLHLSGGHCLKQQPPKRYSAISLLSTTALSVDGRSLLDQFRVLSVVIPHRHSSPCPALSLEVRVFSASLSGLIEQVRVGFIKGHVKQS